MNFSEYLNNYLIENNLSSAQAAKKIGIDRTIFYRYTTGKRTPQSEEQVEEIANRLYMSAEEKKELIEKYDRAVLGDEIVSSFHYVNRLMKTLSNADTFNCQKSFSFLEGSGNKYRGVPEKSSYIASPQAIVECANLIFQGEKVSDKQSGIKMIMQPTYNTIENMLTPLFSELETKIEQIICLEKTIEKSYVNLDIIENLLTPAFCLNNFRVYYHYDILKSHLSTASLLPNMILSDNCALLFDYEMQNGYITQDKEMIIYLKKQFDLLKSKCSSFIENDSYANIVQENSMVIEAARIETLFNQPCIVPCLGRKLLDKYIVNFPMKKQLIDTLIATHGDWDGMKHLPPESYAACYCTEEGILEIFKTGRIAEFPEKFYLPFTKEGKIAILDRMLYLHKNNLHNYVIFKSGANLPDTIQIYCNPKHHTVTLRYTSDDHLMQINIAEISLYNSIMHYLEYINKKGLSKSLQETTDLLNNIREKLINDSF